MVDATKSANTPPVDLPARKIMRRGDETKSGTNTTANSENPSKATSEADGSDGGNDGGGKSKDKSAMTREEREARYREARQRIFGNTQSDETDLEVATSTEEKDASRSSSTSGKKKNKKQRNLDDDDGFEARSRYNTLANILPLGTLAMAPSTTAAFLGQCQTNNLLPCTRMHPHRLAMPTDTRP
jgi:hypothetical protein